MAFFLLAQLEQEIDPSLPVRGTNRKQRKSESRSVPAERGDVRMELAVLVVFKSGARGSLMWGAGRPTPEHRASVR